MYHCVLSERCQLSGFQNKSANEYKLFVDDFVSQLKYLKGKNHRFNLTFDDGGSSFYHVIADLLEENGYIGIFFVTTSFIGNPGFLTVKELRELRKRGHIIGSHSHSHFNDMTVLNWDLAKAEWINSINLLETWLGERVLTASIPNGYSSKMVEKSAKSAGIQYLYDSKPTTEIRNHDGMTVNGRFVVKKGDDLRVLELIDTSCVYRSLRNARYVVLGSLRVLLGKFYFVFIRVVKDFIKYG